MIIDDISHLFNDKGRALVLRKKTTGVYSPSTSSATTTDEDFDVFGFLLDYKNSERDGTQIIAGDRKAVLKAKNIPAVPVIGDFIFDGSKEWRIINVRIVEERGSACLYSCQIRG